MKSIGFIDYYIGEWHANNYPAWINEVCLKYKYDFRVCYAYAEIDKSPVDGTTTEEWCKKFGIIKCDSVIELCEKSDYIIILSPSNPEKHLDMAKQAFVSGKSCFIDKTFAPDYSLAKQIFEIAEKNKIKFYSSSALRYASELDRLNNITYLEIKGGGSNFEEYCIHLLEIAVKVMGNAVKKIKSVVNDVNGFDVYLNYSENREVKIIYSPEFPYEISAKDKDGNNKHFVIQSDFFKQSIKSILQFFETGDCGFDVRETLCIMKIRDKALTSTNKPGIWFDI